MVEDTVALLLKMPRDMRDELRSWATAERRSLTGQILYLLQLALDARRGERGPGAD